jgi:hypothetical protein
MKKIAGQARAARLADSRRSRGQARRFRPETEVKSRPESPLTTVAGMITILSFVVSILGFRLRRRALPGDPLRPYPDRFFTGWTAPAFVGAFGNPG